MNVDERGRLDPEQHAAACGLPGVGPLPGNQLAMPPQERVRRRDGGDLAHGRAADPVCPGRQPAAIVIRQAHSSVPELPTQIPVLFDEVGDRLRSRRSSHRVSTHSTIWSAAGSITRRSLYHRQDVEPPQDVGRLVGHNGLSSGARNG